MKDKLLNKGLWVDYNNPFKDKGETITSNKINESEIDLDRVTNNLSNKGGYDLANG